MSNQKLLEKFGQIYIDFVRDNVIEGMTQIITGEYKGSSGQALQQRIKKNIPDNQEILKEIVYSAADKCLHYTLYMLEEYQDKMKLIVNDQDGNGSSLADISDSLCGELYTEDGWIGKYSKYPTSMPKEEK